MLQITETPANKNLFQLALRNSLATPTSQACIALELDVLADTSITGSGSFCQAAHRDLYDIITASMSVSPQAKAGDSDLKSWEVSYRLEHLMYDIIHIYK